MLVCCMSSQKCIVLHKCTVFIQCSITFNVLYRYNSLGHVVLNPHIITLCVFLCRLPETSGGGTAQVVVYFSPYSTDHSFIDSSTDIRSEAVYLYGTNEMSTRDVFEYFSDYGPSYVEWIDDSSCECRHADTV